MIGHIILYIYIALTIATFTLMYRIIRSGPDAMGITVLDLFFITLVSIFSPISFWLILDEYTNLSEKIKHGFKKFMSYEVIKPKRK